MANGYLTGSCIPNHEYSEMMFAAEVNYMAEHGTGIPRGHEFVVDWRVRFVNGDEWEATYFGTEDGLYQKSAVDPRVESIEVIRPFRDETVRARREAKEKEARERAELARLKAKYEGA